MNLRRALAMLMIMVLLLAYAAALPLVLWGDVRLLLDKSLQIDYLVLIIGFGMALAGAFYHVLRVLRQYTQALHDLSSDDAEALMGRLIFGLTPDLSPGGPTPRPPKLRPSAAPPSASPQIQEGRLPSGAKAAPSPSRGATLNVQGGRVDLNGPPVVHKVGGPAKLKVDHNNVVVTSRLGRLARILGPGSHDLQAFERVWDVVDLRPQRRTVTVAFMTRDGIPAACRASIVCRIASVHGEELEGAMPPFGYSERAVLKVTTSKTVRKHEGSDRVLDWVACMSRIELVDAVREVLEQHHLDELLNPRYWLDANTASRPKPKPVPELEAEIEKLVRDAGARRGIIVERVELGMVRPAEEAISRQWLEFWQARLQRDMDAETSAAAVSLEQLAEDARVDAQVRFVNRMLKEVQGLLDGDVDVPPQLIVASFMEVLHAAMADQGPQQQRLLLQQAEYILKAVRPAPQDDVPSLPGDPSSSPGPR